jgi:hypothetical protein
LDVTYAKAAKGLDGAGRWFAKDVAMQGLNRRLRQTICQDKMIDIDFVNCHPVLLQQIVRDFLRTNCPFLDKYITDRDAMLQEMVDAGVSDRGEAKMLVLKVMNGGSVLDVKTPWWEDLCTEFKDLASKIATHRDHKDFLDHCFAQKGDFNLHARTMAGVLCHAENQCLEQLYHLLKGEDCVPHGQCSLIFDGLMIKDSPFIKAKVSCPVFLEGLTRQIHQVTGYTMAIKVKEFDEIYELPNNYEDSVSDITVIDAGDDLGAADEFLKRFKHRLIRCGPYTFWEVDGIYTDDPQRVKDGVLSEVSRMEIWFRVKDGLSPYSRNKRHAHDCVTFIMASTTTEQPDFIDKLFSSSLRYLAFEDGIYSFERGEILSYADAAALGVYFTMKINRPFPTNVDPEIQEMFMKRVIDPIFPVEKPEDRDYFMHRLSRALAGEIFDKKWHLCTGERNCGKGVIALLLGLAFGPFVQTINSENLLIKAMDNGDAAKGQSWMSPLQRKRIALSNECKMQGGRARCELFVILWLCELSIRNKR